MGRHQAGPRLFNSGLLRAIGIRSAVEAAGGELRILEEDERVTVLAGIDLQVPAQLRSDLEQTIFLGDCVCRLSEQ